MPRRSCSRATTASRADVLFRLHQLDGEHRSVLVRPLALLDDALGEPTGRTEVGRRHQELEPHEAARLESDRAIVIGLGALGIGARRLDLGGELRRLLRLDRAVDDREGLPGADPASP